MKVIFNQKNKMKLIIHKTYKEIGFAHLSYDINRKPIKLGVTGQHASAISRRCIQYIRYIAGSDVEYFIDFCKKHHETN